MSKVSQLLAIGLMTVVISTGCGPMVDQSVPVRQTVGRIKDRWLGAEDTKGVTLEENLLRSNIYLVFDCSGSMEGGKIATAKVAINQFAAAIPEGTGLGLAVFDSSGISERVPLAANNRKQFTLAVNSASAGGGTPLSDAVNVGYEALRVQARRQLGYGEYHLVIVTDGEANFGYDPTSIVNQILQESPVVIHTIGFQIGSRHSLNQPGRMVYKDARDERGLTEGLQEVLAESDKF